MAAAAADAEEEGPVDFEDDHLLELQQRMTPLQIARMAARLGTIYHLPGVPSSLRWPPDGDPERDYRLTVLYAAVLFTRLRDSFRATLGGLANRDHHHRGNQHPDAYGRNCRLTVLLNDFGLLPTAFHGGGQERRRSLNCLFVGLTNAWFRFLEGEQAAGPGEGNPSESLSGAGAAAGEQRRGGGSGRYRRLRWILLAYQVRYPVLAGAPPGRWHRYFEPSLGLQSITFWRHCLIRAAFSLLVVDPFWRLAHEEGLFEGTHMSDLHGVHFRLTGWPNGVNDPPEGAEQQQDQAQVDPPEVLRDTLLRWVCLVIDLIRWYDHEEDKVELGAVVEAEGRELKTELKTQLAAELISVKLGVEVEVVEAVPGVNDFEVDESS
ncbi:hypothetical protein TYRP_000771 [Tyrophagus putrescentiae]|nr:hypothetical protein TYRP_000771 [Tyrophagus putrescentiae]